MTEEMLQTIDPACFDVVDKRIEAVCNGQLSLEAFCMLITDEDPFILVHNVIRVLSEEEFYATRPVKTSNVYAEQIFRKQLDMDSYTMMDQKDSETLAAIKQDLPNCPTCRYKKHVNTVQGIARKYHQDNDEAAFQPKEYIYPQVKKSIHPVVSTLIPHMYQMPVEQRKSCLDCVEKHVSEAFILANEVNMGYPDHFSQVCGHLGQAIDELPPEAAVLKDILRFCLAKTIKDRKPFVPLYSIQGTLRVIRETGVDEGSKVLPDTAEDLEIDISNEMREDIRYISEHLRNKLLKRSTICHDSILEYKKKPKESYKIQFEGSLAVMADELVNISPKLANLCRNRRLLFLADIGTAADSGYDGSDLIELFSSKDS